MFERAPEQGELIAEIEAFLSTNKKAPGTAKPEAVIPTISEIPLIITAEETPNVETPPIDLGAPKRPSRLFSRFNTISTSKILLGFAFVSNSLAAGFDVARAWSNPETATALFVFITWANLNIAGMSGLFLWVGYPSSKSRED